MAKRTLAEDGLELTTEELDELVLDIPLSDRRLVTSSADFSVSTLVSMLREKGLVVPKFQRKYIWSERKASRLIESLILQCPIPVIYLNRRADEVLEVVDGNQRVTTLRRFMDGNFSLSGLTAYPELTGDSFEDLDQKNQRGIRNRTIRCVIIEPESNSQIKFDVFERLNSGSTPLSPQELRHGLYYGPFVQLLADIAADPQFTSLTGSQNDKRMRKDELALRFFAFTDNLAQYRKPLSNFLSVYLKDNREIDNTRAAIKRAVFERMLTNLQILLGPTAFRFRGGDGDVRKFNTAYFDAISVGYARSLLFDANVHLQTIAADVAGLINALADDPTFRLNTLRATSDKAAIEHRIQAVETIFNLFA